MTTTTTMMMIMMMMMMIMMISFFPAFFLLLLLDKMQAYFGNAIRANPKDIVGMRKAVGAVYCHKKSSDEDPVHKFCDVSWCPFLKAKQEGTPYTHSSNSYLPSAVMDLVKPVWKYRCKTELRSV